MDRSVNCKGKLENWVCVFDDSNPKSLKAIGLFVEDDEHTNSATQIVTDDIISISDGILRTSDSCFILGLPKYSEISQMIDFSRDFGFGILGRET